MARVGRKLKLTDRAIEQICEALSIGSPVRIAVSYAGVSIDSYFNWVRKAEAALEKLQNDFEQEHIDPDYEAEPLTDSEVQYIKFFNKTEAAKTNAAIGWIQTIDNEAENDPRWAKFMLKCRYPGLFEDRQNVDVTTAGEPLKGYVIISPDDWDDDDASD